MGAIATGELSEQIAHAALPLSGTRDDFDPLLTRIGDAGMVLLGESTHGTHEFYKARAEITRRLVQEKGFTIVAWEADWPDALRLNRYVRGSSSDKSVLEALGSFSRFPIWMWRNRDIVDLVHWLREHNASTRGPKAGIYGLDLYSLHSSINGVIDYLQKVQPEAAEDARLRYSCFEFFGDDPQLYGMNASQDRSMSCEEEVVQQLLELQRRAGEFLQRDGKIAEDELFYAEQNALVAKNAESYYRAMYRGRPNTWNLRDTHMADTLDNLLAHAQKQGEPAKAVVWAHNSHLGDARETEMGRRGELNVGQLVRERYGGEAVLVGFTTYSGTVTAASSWGGVTEQKRVRPSLEGSCEKHFHESGAGDFMLIFDQQPDIARGLKKPQLERAIGVIYRPETERYSHYFSAQVSQQFDVILHYDHTRAVDPLDRTSEWESGELPETYPSGF